MQSVTPFIFIGMSSVCCSICVWLLRRSRRIWRTLELLYDAIFSLNAYICDTTVACEHISSSSYALLIDYKYLGAKYASSVGTSDSADTCTRHNGFPRVCSVIPRVSRIHARWCTKRRYYKLESWRHLLSSWFYVRLLVRHVDQRAECLVNVCCFHMLRVSECYRYDSIGV